MKKNPTPETVDKPAIPDYTFGQARELLLALLPLLENHKSAPQDALESDTKGVSDMKKRHKQRVRVAVAEDGSPVYKWAHGNSIDELNDNIVRIYIENGLMDRFLRQEQPVIPKIQRRCPRFQEYATNWFETYKVPTLKPTTLQGYRSNFRIHLFPAFGKMRLDEITTDEIQRFLNERQGLARNTVHTMFVLLSEILASAYEDRLIPSDPSKSKRLSIPSHKKKERQALSPDQLKEIIGGIARNLPDDDERRLISLMLFTGMRRGEVLGLRWEDIDFQKKLIHVERAISYTTNQPIVSSTKTQSGRRIIPLDDQLVEFLKPHCAQGFVIGGKEPITQMVFRRLFRQVTKKVDLQGATPRVFRHSYISALSQTDVDLKTIQKISGHSSITTTMNIYAHTRESLVQEAGAKVGRLLS